MIYVFAGALLVLAGFLVWLSSLLGVAGLIISLFLALSALIAGGLVYWLSNREDHLYEDLPRIQDIRKPLTPVNYALRSNLDPPFFSFESQNYGDSRPRTRIKNVPIDRFLELQDNIDGLTDAIAQLSKQLVQAHSEIASLKSEDEQTELPANVVHEHEADAPAAEPEPAAERPRPLIDTTVNRAQSRGLFKRAPALPTLPETKPLPRQAEGRKYSGDSSFGMRLIELIANNKPQLPRLWNHR